MRVRRLPWLAVTIAIAWSLPAWAQAPAASPAARPRPAPTATPELPPPPTPTPATPTPPPPVEGYVGELTMETSLQGMQGAPASPEAQALLGQLRDRASLRAQMYLAQKLSRLEVLSPDFLLPAGTIVQHEAGSKFYVIADPKAQTYVVMDVEGILRALEGGIGIENSEYSAKVRHTGEKKTIAGVAARQSILTVNYVSSVPFENEKVMVRQTNDIEIWHTPEFVSAALLDHFFFKFERDMTGTVQKVVGTDIGFPLEMSMSVTQGNGPKAHPVGTLHMVVGSLRRDRKLSSELFRMPPAGYRKLDRNPYFAGAHQ